MKRESRISVLSGNQSFCCQLTAESVAEGKVEAGVSFFEELQGRREEGTRTTTAISRHSAAEKQNVEARITHGCRAFEPSGDPSHCYM